MNSAQESQADITKELNALNGTHDMNEDFVLNKLNATSSNDLTSSKTNTVEDIMKSKIDSLESYLDSRVINIYQRPWNKLELKLKIRKIEEYYNTSTTDIINAEKDENEKDKAKDENMSDIGKSKSKSKSKTKTKGVEALTNYSIEDTLTFLQGYNSDNKKIKIEYDMVKCHITSLYVI